MAPLNKGTKQCTFELSTTAPNPPVQCTIDHISTKYNKVLTFKKIKMNLKLHLQFLRQFSVIYSIASQPKPLVGLYFSMYVLVTKQFEKPWLRSDIINKLELIQSLYFDVFLYCRHNNMLYLSLSVFLCFSHSYWLDLQGFFSFWHYLVLAPDRQVPPHLLPHSYWSCRRERERERERERKESSSVRTASALQKSWQTYDMTKSICAEVIFWTQILLENSSLGFALKAIQHQLRECFLLTLPTSTTDALQTEQWVYVQCCLSLKKRPSASTPLSLHLV